MSSFRKFTLDRADFGPPPPIDLGDHAHAPVRGRTRVKQEEDATAQTPALTPAPRRISITQATPVAFEETGSEETAPHDNEAVCEQAPAAGATPQESRFSLRKRFAALFALLAVPAMAAPGDFGALAGDAPTEGSADAAGFSPDDAMPFERPGMSFPGSAFYYLADPPAEALLALPSSDPLDTGAEAGREIGQAIDAGPAARPIYSAGAGTSHTRALQCLSQAIWYEAASESEAGQRAVAQVVLNRVAHPSWPASVCGVVYEGSQRSTGCQFSFTCDGSLARRAS
ncbi:MAG: cell wall hydrolase, partial [Pseudomonadota bacterium]|nr:cell wall hydrolase [Pseudomonadota bacterium]